MKSFHFELPIQADISVSVSMAALLNNIPHPYGVKAEGNLLLASPMILQVRSQGLGNLSALIDENLLEILGYLNAKELCSVGVTSRACYVFSHHSDLWRDLTLRCLDGQIEYEATWRDTYVKKSCDSINMKYIKHVPIKVSGIFSAPLHRSWTCSTFDYDLACPGFLRTDEITREDSSLLSVESFVSRYEIPNKPVIITNLVSTWPAFKLWDDDYLSACAGTTPFRATSTTAPMAATFTLQQYFLYAKQSKDEAPFYLFDRDYAKIHKLENDYTVPKYFSRDASHGTDLFRLFGDDRRPDYRWLIIGPARSGSIYHIDPNQTNAWNACIRGRKKWIFYPPGVSPPGIMTSNDDGDVMVPLSTGEWLLSFWKHHQEARAHPNIHKRPLECIVNPGEIIFVPHNWWHMVVNLDDCVALTHNYVSSSNLSSVLRFLYHKSDQISGVRDRPTEAVQPEHMYDEFVSRLKDVYPEVLKTAEQSISAKAFAMNSNSIFARSRKSSKRKRALDCQEKVSYRCSYDSSHDDKQHAIIEQNDHTNNSSFSFSFHF